jgi:hypothetical protein
MSQSTSELRVVYDFSTQFLRFLDGRELGYRSLSCEISPSQVHRKTRWAWVNVFGETPPLTRQRPDNFKSIIAHFSGRICRFIVGAKHSEDQ